MLGSTMGGVWWRWGGTRRFLNGGKSVEELWASMMLEQRALRSSRAKCRRKGEIILLEDGFCCVYDQGAASALVSAAHVL